MSLFAGVKTEGVEAAKDVLGGANYIKETDIYLGTVRQAYGIISKNGSIGVSLEVELEDSSKYKETIYMTNVKGEAYYVKDGNKLPLPGFTVINDICLLLTDNPIDQQNSEEKVVAVYDFESGKDVNREMPVLVDLIGGEIALAIQKKRENKTKKNERTGKYEPINEERISNNIAKVMHPEMKCTVNEAIDGTEPTFWDKWLERNQDKTYDSYKEVSGGGRSGAPSKGGDSSPSGEPRKSIFGKKKD
jgi:hypothetical protein